MPLHLQVQITRDSCPTLAGESIIFGIKKCQSVHGILQQPS